MKKGLYIGRFQPFHLGHLDAVQQALTQVDFLTIGIGSAQYSETADNPFTAQERRRMIEASLDGAGIESDRFTIAEVSDIHDDAAWPAHVREFVGHFEVVFTQSEVVRDLFEKYDEANVMWLQKNVDVSATEVREKMREGGVWQNDLPEACVAFLSTTGMLL
jgi:nicotinamide-nucleotide adenylyltransferase